AARWRAMRWAPRRARSSLGDMPAGMRDFFLGRPRTATPRSLGAFDLHRCARPNRGAQLHAQLDKQPASSLLIRVVRAVSALGGRRAQASLDRVDGGDEVFHFW